MSITVDRSDITLEEQTEEEYSPFESPSITRRWWEARLFGSRSTGEHVEMARTADTPAEALTALENAIHGFGWEIL